MEAAYRRSCGWLRSRYRTTVCLSVRTKRLSGDRNELPRVGCATTLTTIATSALAEPPDTVRTSRDVVASVDAARASVCVLEGSEPAKIKV